MRREGMRREEEGHHEEDAYKRKGRRGRKITGQEWEERVEAM